MKILPLSNALLLLKNNKEVNEFLTDLCTPSELKALNERWSVAQTLNKNELSYREIADKVKTRTSTVTRVARFLSSEQNDGYKTILKRIK